MSPTAKLCLRRPRTFSGKGSWNSKSFYTGILGRSQPLRITFFRLRIKPQFPRSTLSPAPYFVSLPTKFNALVCGQRCGGNNSIRRGRRLDVPLQTPTANLTSTAETDANRYKRLPQTPPIGHPERRRLRRSRTAKQRRRRDLRSGLCPRLKKLLFPRKLTLHIRPQRFALPYGFDSAALRSG